MTKEEAYEEYPSLRIMSTHDLIGLLEGAHELEDYAFAEAINAILKETKPTIVDELRELS